MRPGLSAIRLCWLAWIWLALSAGPVVAASLKLGSETEVELRPEVVAGFNISKETRLADFSRQLRRVPPAHLRFKTAAATADAVAFDALKLELTTFDRDHLPGLLVQIGLPAGAKPASADGAADAVNAARERGLRVSAWEIGNEPDAEPGDGKGWTPERYCDAFRSRAAAIKRADPQARVAGPAVSGAAASRDRFMEGFVQACGDVVDVLTWHLYPTDGSPETQAALATAEQTDAVLAAYRNLWADPLRNPLGYRRKAAFGVTEYGLSWRADSPRLLADMPAALWAAEAALRLARGGVQFAHYYAYQGEGEHGLLDSDGMPRPSYYAFRQLSGLRGRFVDIQSSETGLWVHALRDGKRLAVILMNTSDQPITVSTALPGMVFAGGQSFTAKEVQEGQPDAAVMVGAQQTLAPMSMSLWRYGSGLGAPARHKHKKTTRKRQAH